MPESNKQRFALCCAAVILITLCGELTARAAPAPTPTPTPELNTIKLGACSDPETIEQWVAAERKKGNVIDARPFAVNPTTGQLSFSGSTGRFSVVHMNPFVFNYRITVAQEELVSTALSDFLKLVLPPNLGTVLGLQSGRVGAAGESLATPGRLAQIADRLDGLRPADCKSSADPNNTKTAPCIAAGEMYETFDTLRDSGLLGGPSTTRYGTNYADITSASVVQNDKSKIKALEAYQGYVEDVANLRDEQADAYKTCKAAEKLNLTLGKYNFDATLDRLDAAQQAVSEVVSLATDLEELATAFKNDNELKDPKHGIRCKGFNCADQFEAYAKAARGILELYGREITALRENTVRMQQMYKRTERMKKEEGHFARTSTIIKKFELSQATITVNRTDVVADTPAQTQNGRAGGGNGGAVRRNGGNVNRNGGGDANRQPAATGSGGAVHSDDDSDNDGGSNSKQSAGGDNDKAQGDGGGDDNQGEGAGDNQGGGNNQGSGNNLAPPGQVTEVVQIGRPRFALSGGLVYSPLARRTFASVKGFARDAEGNPTGDGSADVVGFGENSTRRLLPMVLLNSRLTNFGPANLFFTWGVSAKRDDNVDIEYLFGPSLSFLGDRAFFTFGAYGGQTQNLVADVAVGDALPGSIGDAKLYRKSLIWKPGFSFSYNLSRTKKADAAATGSATRAAAPADDLKSELRIGGIPFNLALGVAFTSLEQRAYDEIVGFARDRQGNLTNGRTLTRIVGLSSSSDYRLTPLALLHTRLTKFGRHDFYFSTGVTGKKTDKDFDIEYLLGGSVNLYRRKVFLTVGAFAGKQQTLGGDFFEGAALGSGQSVTTQNRYVWKPAISFSYDITRIIPRSQQQ